MTPPLKADVILEGIALRKSFARPGFFGKGSSVIAVSDVSLKVHRGETLAIVGESGCGKSTLARMLLNLIPPTSGDILFEGQNLGNMTSTEARDVRRRLQMIFQDPFASLNPAMTAGAIVEEPIALHRLAATRALRRERVAELLRQVGLPPSAANRHPHEFSGGQRQRIGIARALASSPALILGDEPFSALDVSVQAQIVNLLQDLKQRFDLTLVIVAHDLAMVRHVSDRVAVMYLGKIVEIASADALFRAPLHPYTRALIDAAPKAVPGIRHVGSKLEGEAVSTTAAPHGCSFHPRCGHAQPLCRQASPSLETARPGYMVACHFWKDIAATTLRSGNEGFASDIAMRRVALFRGATAGRASTV